jgi:7-carboxy-7-deazaguanine synthase
VKTFRVKEVFATLQGEGGQVGCPSIFVRFSGCNLWSGYDHTRQHDAERHDVSCPLWCDTDFRTGDTLHTQELTDLIQQTASDAGMPTLPLVVLTGGEPLLQLTPELASSIKEQLGCRLALETNGVTPLTDALRPHLDWICVSPKAPPERLLITKGNEMKVIFPAYNPSDYDSIALTGFSHRFVQPQAQTEQVGVSSLQPSWVQQAVTFCLHHPHWRLSLQTHKYINLP